VILLIDNYDSFVHNLARYLCELGQDTHVVRNDAITIDAIRQMAPAGIVISPGPCTPNEAGVSLDIVRELGPKIPTLGVCLGHQAIGAALGADVVRAPTPVHGRTSRITHDGVGLFNHLPSPMTVNRYHSLIIDPASIPDALRITAWTTDGIPMAIEHRDWPLWGVHFHPESILTQGGHRLLANYLELAGLPVWDLPEQEGGELPLNSGNDEWPPRGPLPITW